MDGEAWWAAVHGVAKSRTRLSDFTVTFRFITEPHVWIFLLSSNHAHGLTGHLQGGVAVTPSLGSLLCALPVHSAHLGSLRAWDVPPSWQRGT